jgi:pimeloyl-ACP methyl ester carboxylesterase
MRMRMIRSFLRAGRLDRRTMRWFITTSEMVITTSDGKWQLPITIHHSASKNEISTCPILLIAGWTGIASDWGIIPKLLASKTQQNVITYDPRWLGQSTALKSNNDDELTWDIVTQDALDVLRYSTKQHRDNHTKYCVVGASMGGIVAQRLVAFDQVDIESLVLVCTTTLDRDYSISHNFLNLFDDTDENDEISQSVGERFFETLGADFLAKPGRAKLRDRLVQAYLSSRNKVGIRKQRRLLDLDPREHTAPPPSIRPCLVMHGTLDSVIDCRAASQLQDQLGPLCELQIFHNSDHLLWITDGMRLVDEISAFHQRVHGGDE